MMDCMMRSYWMLVLLVVASQVGNMDRAHAADDSTGDDEDVQVETVDNDDTTGIKGHR